MHISNNIDIITTIKYSERIMDIKFENRIIDDFIIDEKRERAKYMLCSKKRYDFIWRICV